MSCGGITQQNADASFHHLAVCKTLTVTGAVTAPVGNILTVNADRVSTNVCNETIANINVLNSTTVNATNLNVDNLVISGSSSSITYRQTTLVSASQLLNIFAVPMLLVSCPVGFNLVPTGVFATYIPSAVDPVGYQFVDSDYFNVGFDVAPGSQSNINIGSVYYIGLEYFIDQITANIQPSWFPYQDSGIVMHTGENMYLSTGIGNLTTGNGSVEIVIDYSLAPSG